jgi:hypothetical protein
MVSFSIDFKLGRMIPGDSPICQVFSVFPTQVAVWGGFLVFSRANVCFTNYAKLYKIPPNLLIHLGYGKAKYKRGGCHVEGA